MAILKMTNNPIHPGSGKGGTYKHLKYVIDYVLKLEKTAEGLYSGTLNCMPQTALEEMIETKKHYGKEPKNKNDRLAYHFIISWSPKEKVSPEMALQITKELCEEYLSEYEVAYASHLDRPHMHTHFVFNSVNFMTGRKYRYEKNDWAKVLQPLLDSLCEKHGLHTLKDDTGKTPEEHRYSHTGEKRKKAKSDRIRKELDELIIDCGTFEEFEQGLRQKGYQIKYGISEEYGEYLSVRNPEMERFRKTYRLGEDYTLNMIKSRIAAYHDPIPNPDPGQEEAYPITNHIFRCRIYFRTNNVYLRKQYARMYRLGILPGGGRHPSYQETILKIKELRRLECQLNLIAENDYRKAEDLDADIAVITEEIKNLKKECREQTVEKKPFAQMLTVYEKLEELEGAFLLWQEGDDSFQEEAYEYEVLKERAEIFPHTREELKAYAGRQNILGRKTKRRLREEEKRLEALKELKTDYELVMKEYEPADNEILKNMERYGGKAETENHRLRGKGL